MQPVMEREALPPLTAEFIVMSGAVVEMTPDELGVIEMDVRVNDPVEDTLNRVHPSVADESPANES